MPAPGPLQVAARLFRSVAHPLISQARGGGGVRVRARGWPIAVHPRSYNDLRHWLRYEGSTWATVRRIWRPGMTVVDVGAHYGLFSLCFFRPGTRTPRIVAVEPSAAARTLLEANRGIHSGADWSIVPRAIGEREGVLTLHAGWTEMLIVDPASHPGASGEPVKVPMTTLDRLCEELALTPDVVKIDVEGYEAEALAGARATLARQPVVLLELHWDMLRARGIDAVAALDPLIAAGYRFEPYEFSGTPPLTAGEFAAWRHDHADAGIVRLLCRSR